MLILERETIYFSREN